MATKKTRGSQSFPRYATKGLKEGILHKRQRGRKTNDLSGLKFQSRYCVLNLNLLSYYKSKSKKDFGHRPSGSYHTSKIKIVETVPDLTFRRPHCFQIGNEKEVMYFSASSKRDRDAWIETFRIAAFGLGKNQPLLVCHMGAYGQTGKNQWSCCNKEGREAKGCWDSNPPSVDQKMPVKRITSPSREDSLQSMSVPLSSPYLSTSPQNQYSDSDSEDDDEEEQPATCPEETWNSNQSRQSIDSGKGGSTSTLNTVASSSPAPSRQKKAWDKALGSATIVEEDPSHAHSLTDKVIPFVYTHKTTLQPEEDSSYATTVLYRGVDSVIEATSTGKVSTSTVNTGGSQKQTIFAGKGEIAVSVSIWRNHIAFGSEAIYLGNIDSTGVKILGSLSVHNEVSPQLVAFCPDRSFFSASKGGHHVSMWSKREDGSHVEATEKPNCTLKVAEDDDQIFSLTVSPKRSWLAIGVTSSNSDFVYIYRFKDRFVFHGRTEIGQESGVCLAFTHDGEYLFVGSDLRIQCFNVSDDQATSRLADSVFNHTFKQDSSIKSLACSPVRHHLAVGLSTGEVKVFTGHPRFLNHMPSTMTIQDSKTQSSGAVTSLSYSRDGMKTAVAFDKGTVQIWKGSRPPEEPKLIKHSVTVTSKSQTVDEDGYSIFIPEGAVKEGTKITLHHGVAPHSPYGPFDFDEGAQPVSPIILLCPEPANTVFLKPIEVTLPHFIACETQEDCNKLSFSKARHDNFRVDNSRKIYKFEKVTDGKMVHLCQYDRKSKIPQGAATLYTQHCCYICIQENISEEETNSKKVFSLAQIVPKHRDYSKESRVYYCLSYHLKTCLKVLEEQFPDDLYIKSMKTVSFEDVGASQKRVLKIQLHSESGLSLPGGWALQMINGGQIAEQNLCFWDDEIRSNIEELCQTKEYPPKIPLHVVPGQDLVTEGVSTMVSFTGVRMYQSEDTNVKFMLELTLRQMPPRNSVSSGRRLSSLSSSYTSHESASPLITTSVKITPDSVEDLDLQDQFDDIAKTVDCKRLASALFTESSPKKCPYLSDDSKKTIRSFLTRSRTKCDTPDEKFWANYDILVDANEIATKHPQYITAVQAALNRARLELQKDGLGVNRSKRESVGTASVLSFTAEDNSPPVQEANLTPPPMPRSTFPTEYSQSTPNDNHSSFILPFKEPPIANPIL